MFMSKFRTITLLIFLSNISLNKHLQLVRSLSDSAAEIKAWEMVITIDLQFYLSSQLKN